MLKRACPEEILNQVPDDTFGVQHDISPYFVTFSEISAIFLDKAKNFIH
jgi:hypothetical protein